MEYKEKIYYELTDYYPSILKTNIPILDIIIYIVYYLGLPFYMLKVYLKTKRNLFKKRKKEIYKGPIKSTNIYKTPKNKEFNNFKNNVLETNLTYYYPGTKDFKDVINEIPKELLLSLNISNKFVIRKRIEKYAIDANVDLSPVYLLSYTPYTIKFEKILRRFK
jgi:hypothetical protein